MGSAQFACIFYLHQYCCWIYSLISLSKTSACLRAFKLIFLYQAAPSNSPVLQIYWNCAFYCRYQPQHQPNLRTFTLAGVQVIVSASDCSEDHCNIKLTRLLKHHSDGAYRCEVSTEGPQFRLAAATHNITVASEYSIPSISQRNQNIIILLYLPKKCYFKYCVSRGLLLRELKTKWNISNMLKRIGSWKQL